MTVNPNPPRGHEQDPQAAGPYTAANPAHLQQLQSQWNALTTQLDQLDAEINQVNANAANDPNETERLQALVVRRNSVANQLNTVGDQYVAEMKASGGDDPQKKAINDAQIAETYARMRQANAQTEALTNPQDKAAARRAQDAQTSLYEAQAARVNVEIDQANAELPYAGPQAQANLDKARAELDQITSNIERDRHANLLDDASAARLNAEVTRLNALLPSEVAQGQANVGLTGAQTTEAQSRTGLNVASTAQTQAQTTGLQIENEQKRKGELATKIDQLEAALAAGTISPDAANELFFQALGYGTPLERRTQGDVVGLGLSGQLMQHPELLGHPGGSGGAAMAKFAHSHGYDFSPPAPAPVSPAQWAQSFGLSLGPSPVPSSGPFGPNGQMNPQWAASLARGGPVDISHLPPDQQRAIVEGRAPLPASQAAPSAPATPAAVSPQVGPAAGPSSPPAGPTASTLYGGQAVVPKAAFPNSPGPGWLETPTDWVLASSPQGQALAATGRMLQPPAAATPGPVAMARGGVLAIPRWALSLAG